MALDKKSRRPDQPGDRETTLENLYLDSLLLMGRQAGELCPQEGRAAQETLLRLRRRLTYRSEVQDLQDAHDAVHATMRDFGSRSRDRSSQVNSELNGVFDTATRMADLYAARDRAHLERLRDLTRKMQDLAVMGDPQLNAVALALTQLTDTFQDDHVLSQLRARRELAGFEQRRKSAEEQSVVDALTGFLTRPEIESRMRDALSLGRQFCILKLGIHEFSGLAEQYGEEAHEQLRKAAADKLCDQVRPRDLIAQWDPSTFVLLFFDCTLAVAESRAEEISAWLSGDYRLYVGTEVLHADVQLTAAATEARAGEHPDHFVARAAALSPAVLTPAGSIR
jgi:GGDEF domain-containing protein